MPTATVNPQAELAKVIAAAEKKFGAGIIHRGSEHPPIYKLPFIEPNMNYATEGGLAFGRVASFAGDSATGKALALDTPVPTPSGWTTMGDVEVGDQVFDDQGRPTTVVETSPVFVDHDCYKIVFDDGSQIIADADHRWNTSTSLSRQAHKRAATRVRSLATGRGKQQSPQALHVVRTTEEIAATITQSGSPNHRIDNHPGMLLPKATLPIDPYVLGCWLGDGSSASAEFHNPDQPIIDQITVAGYEMTHYAMAEGKTCPRYNIVGLRKQLAQAGLLNNKHVPREYMRASREQRLSLLQGLMDTDGYCSPGSGYCEFTNTNTRLAADTYELICSLGIKCRNTEGLAKLYGRVIGPKWRISFSSRLPVFRLPRKLVEQQPALAREGGAADFRTIMSCEKIETVPTRCIAVDSKSHLFLVGAQMVVTHNTRCAYEQMAQLQALPGSLEVYSIPRIAYHAARSDDAQLSDDIRQAHEDQATWLTKELEWVRTTFPQGGECVTGDTLVAVADGRIAVSIKELAESEGDVDVFASDDGRTVIKKMRPRLTRRNAELVRVMLDDGSHLRCTPDHELMLWNGQYRRADELRSGDSLMRFDSAILKEERRSIWMGPKPRGGRNLIHRDGGWKTQYKMISEHHDGELPKGWHIHHIDEDSLNDNYSNLVQITASEHGALHMNKRWRDMSPAQREYLSSQTSKAQKARWAKMTIEERSQFAKDREAAMKPGQRGAITRKMWAAKTPLERSAISNSIHASMTPEERSQRAANGRASMTAEARRASGEKAAKTLGSDGCRARSIKANASLTAEQLSARAMKAWETKRAKADTEKTHNHKVVSVEPDGVEDVYCGEVDDVHNFSVITSLPDDLRMGNYSGITIHNCAFYNAEMQYNEDYAAQVGVDNDRVHIVDSTIIEEICEMMEALFEHIPMHVVDSTSYASSNLMLKEDVGKSLYAVDARQWKSSLKHALPHFDKARNQLIMIHQMSTNMRTGGMQANSTSFMRFASSCSIKFTRGKFLWLKDGVLVEDKIAGADDRSMAGRAEPDGVEVFATCEKSRTCRPFKTAGMQWSYRKPVGYVAVHDLAQSALYFGLVRKSGSWYTVEGEDKNVGQGLKSVYARLADDGDLRADIVARLLDYVSN